MHIKLDKESCCGCGVCESVCGTKAINLTVDEEGFLYPEINREKCVDCGICSKLCAFQNNDDLNKKISLPKAYGVKHKDQKTRQNSRSGGMFTAISDYVLEKQGIVIGVGYGENFQAVHKIAVNKQERDEFRGSKYVQSDMKSVLIIMKQYLDEGKLVLFTGTACQTASVRMKYPNYDNLILCDIVCHGVPSPQIWSDYLKLIEKKYHSKITEVDFRNKKLFGWDAHYETFKLKRFTIFSNVYAKLFYKNHILRECCYSCKYTNLYRPSDITLADFWGVDQKITEFNDHRGVSLVFLNSKKGEELFNTVKSDVDFKVSSDLNFEHPNLIRPTERPVDREKFWKDYNENGFKYCARKYGDFSLVSDLKALVHYVLYKKHRK